ncbi:MULTISPECIES: dephospho-CoA kinase [Campylobacter]|uniref:dephospho-CoA kinase n=1 Tax=Campylobacter TaxID=194 RepID=UPI000A35147A|nr:MULTISPECIES: dephospho-CoA kinase [unclassified Campylobacter]MCR8678643.1 dephospho-CoA kinase [Campylobacter sp. RM19072]MCR8696608.1 dephospho-CoA kinase [Campylobacter sp. RM19073]
MSDFKNAIVITGVIGSGKSTVVNLLRVYGFSIIDADEIAHKVLDESSSIIASKFGSEFVSDNRVDRKSLGKLIFSDSKAKKELENILHDRIKEQIFSKANNLESSNYPYFIDLPLYFEKSPVYDEFQSVCVVYAPRQICIERIVSRNNLTLKEAKERINQQISIDKKLKFATYVIDNSLDLKHLNLEVDKFILALKAKYQTLKI